MSTKKKRKKQGNVYGTMEVEYDNLEKDVVKVGCLYKNQPIAKKWIILHCILLIVSIVLVTICFVVPLTGSLLLYSIILLCISIDTILTILLCKNGVCCKSSISKINRFDDILSIITVILWILSLFIAIMCGISDTSSKYTSYNRWEEFVPILLAILIIILLCQKLLIRIYSNSLPFIYNTNYIYYNKNIVLNSRSYINYLIPFKWLIVISFIILSFMLFIHSAQKSLFINSFNNRNTHILTTDNFGTFEYQCIGTTDPENAEIRIISVAAMASIHLSFGWYNNLIYNEYGIQQNKNITICGYNRGGLGFTETKKYYDKTIESDVQHLMEISNVLFGNKTFHLIGHSRAGLMLLQAKMLYIDRIASIAIFDGVSNANKLQNWITNTTQRAFQSNYDIYTLISIATPLMTFEIAESTISSSSGVSDKSKMYEADLTAKYYVFRNYHYQSVVWEGRDMKSGWENTVKLYNTGNYILDPVFSVECDEDYNEDIWYSQINNTLYVKAAHSPCVFDKDIANLIFYYNDNGLKAFYDLLFL